MNILENKNILENRKSGPSQNDTGKLFQTFKVEIILLFIFF